MFTFRKIEKSRFVPWLKKFKDLLKPLFSTLEPPSYPKKIKTKTTNKCVFGKSEDWKAGNLNIRVPENY